MTEPTPFQSEALIYLQLIRRNPPLPLSENEQTQLNSYLIDDLNHIGPENVEKYINCCFSEIPPNSIPWFLDFLQNLTLSSTTLQKIAYALLNSNRPIYQLKALPLIRQLNLPVFAPLVYELIFSTQTQLQQQSIDTLLHLNGNIEFILEQGLNEKSVKKRAVVIKVLTKYNPNNLKLAQINLQDPDFVTRITAIKILATTKDRKWIPKISTIVQDTDLAVQRAAIEALAELGGRRVKQLLTERLKIETYEPMRNIIQANLNKCET